MIKSIKIEFPDSSVKSYKVGITCLEILKTISNSLFKKTFVASLDDQLVDISHKILNDSKIKFYSWDDDIGKSTFWHSSAHLLAEAIESIYPGVKFGIGPPIANGFYYDIDFDKYDTSKIDLEKIENKVIELSRNKSEYVREEISKADAIKFFDNKSDNLKLDLLKDLNDGEITFYKQGNFIDLCKGPHIPNTFFIKAVKILNVAGAYWRGDEKNKQLTRLYAITFPKQKELDNHLLKLEEAKKRDHRKLGKDLDLYFFSEKVGQGLPMWLPNGNIIRENLMNFMRNEQIS